MSKKIIFSLSKSLFWKAEKIFVNGWVGEKVYKVQDQRIAKSISFISCLRNENLNILRWNLVQKIFSSFYLYYHHHKISFSPNKQHRKQFIFHFHLLGLRKFLWFYQEICSLHEMLLNRLISPRFQGKCGRKDILN